MNGSGLGPGGSLRCRVEIHLESSSEAQTQVITIKVLVNTPPEMRVDMICVERWDGKKTSDQAHLRSVWLEERRDLPAEERSIQAKAPRYVYGGSTWLGHEIQYINQLQQVEFITVAAQLRPGGQVEILRMSTPNKRRLS